LKRHGYYCRSRRAATVTRVRSCIPCARAKARCDNRWPECSRCGTKATTCQYPVDSFKGTGIDHQHGKIVTVDEHRPVPSLEKDSFGHGDPQSFNNERDSLFDGQLVVSNSESSISEDYFDWNNPEHGFPDFLDNYTNDDTAIQTPSTWSTSGHHATASIDHTLQWQQAISSLNTSVPRLYPLRTLAIRSNPQSGTQRTANLMLHILKSYPLMMLRDKTLPPFIHPYLVSSEIDSPCMEPLTNCINLLNMIGTGFRGSRRLFWKNVQMECEHFCCEVC
jgi:hypothetical protein